MSAERTPSTEQLIRLATEDGIDVVWHHGGHKGLWSPTSRRISLRDDLDPVQERCTLAHELGHARYGHPGGHDMHHETQADEYAANLLVSPAEYALAEQVYGPSPPRLAAELSITVHILTTWQCIWMRRHPSPLGITP